jgi:hypothetical protein
MWYFGQFNLNNNCLLKKTAAPGKSLRPLSFDEPPEAVIFSFVRS